MNNTKSEFSTLKTKQQKWVRPLFLWLLVAILAASSGLLGFMWYREREQTSALQTENNQFKQQIANLQEKLAAAEAVASTPDDNEPCSEDPSDELKANIKAALETKNTAAFETYTTNPVYYVLAASEYGGEISPTDAAVALEYTHSATAPWDFALPAATIATYDAGDYTDYFDENTYVGRSADGMVVAFDFACGDKIKQIFVAADESIL
jgi:cytoskeletal protein RodZ